MAEHEQTVFRQKTIDRISSPEQLSDYLCVTNPGIWVILAAVVLLLAGLIGWAMIETLETTAAVKVIVEEHTAQVLPLGAETMKDGMPLRVAGQEFFIASIGVDDYDRSFGVAEVTLPNGVYDGDVVVEQTRPIDFLMESR